MKLGRIFSRTGNVVLARVDSEISTDVDLARRIIGKTAYLDNKKAGRIHDIIGKIERPYLVIRIFPNFKGEVKNSLVEVKNGG